MSEYSIFDIIGPIMIGPSSSHTAGANRIGYIAKSIIKEPIKDVTFYLHGSFAKTYKGHGTDKALLAGILGFLPDDERIRNAFTIAKDRGLTFNFIPKDLGDVHPNTVLIEATTVDGTKWDIMGSSLGAGKVKIIKINTMDTDIDGEYTTLITYHVDYPGVVANITSILAKYSINIAFMKLFREHKGSNAILVIETDEDIPYDIVKELNNTQYIHMANIIDKIL